MCIFKYFIYCFLSFLIMASSFSKFYHTVYYADDTRRHNQLLADNAQTFHTIAGKKFQDLRIDEE